MTMARSAAILFFLLHTLPFQDADAFLVSSVVRSSKPLISASTLFMGGLNRKRNQQADLLAAMQQAKKQSGKGGESDDDDKVSAKKKKPTAEEVKEQNDRRRFEDLLGSESATLGRMNELGEGQYKTNSQEEEEINAGYSGVDRLYEGDPAPSLPFENLIPLTSINAIGAKGAERLLPWLRTKNKSETDFVIIVSDPRPKSTELRSAIKNLENAMQADIMSKLVVVNADTPAENKRWLKRDKIEGIKIYSDENKDWMREYTALGEKRWSITMFILANGRLARLVRELDYEVATTVIGNAVKSYMRDV